MAVTFRALAALLDYPTSDLKAALPEIAAALAAEALVDTTLIQPLISRLAREDIYDLQERYFLLFDRSRRLSLHLFEHVHGESRDRGQAMADLVALYGEHGLTPRADELPDYLPLFLEFLSLVPLAEARTLLAEPAGILAAIAERLADRDAAYGAIFQVLCMLAATARAALPNAPEMPDAPELPEDLDATWEEAAVGFGPGEAVDGCSTARLVTRLRAAQRDVRSPEATA